MTLRLFLLNPPTVFTARVNMTSFSYPVDQVTYDNATGNYADIKPHQTVLFGTTAGADDLGRQRIRKESTADTLYIGRSSAGTNDGEVDLQDDAHITVLNDFRVWNRVPVFATDGSPTQYKDSEIAVGDYYLEQPPVANGGPGVMATIDGSNIITVDFDAGDSFAVATGASITTYTWAIEDGTLTSGTLASQAITVTFPAGFRWVRLVVGDDNGKTGERYIPVFARDPASDDTIAFQIESWRRTKSGQEISVRIREAIDAGDYPDGTLAMIADGEPANAADRSHMKFIGWHQTDPAEIQATRTGTLQDTVLDLVDVAGRMKTLRAYSVSIQNEAYRDTDVDAQRTWNYMSSPDMNKLIHYILRWHSTAWLVADFYDADNGSDYPFLIRTLPENNLYDQLNGACNSMTPDYYLNCDRLGRLRVVVDPLLQAEGDRPAATLTLDAADFSDIQYTGQRSPRVYEIDSGAIRASTNETLTPLFCRAPGDAPGQGLNRLERNEGLTPSQAALNIAEGHRYARRNARQTHFRMTLAAGDDQDIDPALMNLIALTVPSSVAAQRGLSLSSANGLVHEVNIRYQHTRTGTVQTVDLIWERETLGPRAKTVIVEQSTNPPDDGDYWPGDWQNDLPGGLEPSETGFGAGVESGQNNVALVDDGGYLYRTGDFQNATPTWDQVDMTATVGTTVYSFVVDPFSPGYIDTGTNVNGWVVTDTDIYYIENMFGASPSVSSQHTFGTTLTAVLGSRTVNASFGRFFDSDVAWVGVHSHYVDETGHTGSWFIYSQDGGATWSSEVQISAHYNTSGGAAQDPPLYLSPKTPGLAYTTAFTATASDPSAAGWVSTDWGATWSQISNPDIDPGVRLAQGMHVPWINNDDEGLVYHCYNDTTTDPGTTSTFRTRRVNGATITDISPLVSSLHYGPRLGKFSIRCYDSDRRFVAMVGMADTNPDTTAAFVSNDDGDNWTTIVSPVQTDNASPREIAFAGDSSDVLYIWGFLGYIGYSEDFGSTVSDKSGSITSFAGNQNFIGLAGGVS